MTELSSSATHPVAKAVPGQPVLDMKKPYGIIAHGDLQGQNPSELPMYHQDGNYFRPDKSFHSKDGQPVKVAAKVAVAPAQVQTLPAVKPEEVPALLADPRAAELLALPRDELVKLVTAAGGPMVAGDGSTRLMVAWLVKNTKSDGDAL